jgi:hypothetical protein
MGDFGAAAAAALGIGGLGAAAAAAAFDVGAFGPQQAADGVAVDVQLYFETSAES